MKQSRLTKKFLIAAVGGTLAFGASTQASAAPNFEYDIDGLSGAGTTFTANSVAGVSSEGLQVTVPGSQFAGSGWVQFTSINLGTSELTGTDYANTGLYGLFTINVTLTFGTFGVPTSLYSVDVFNFSLYRDTGTVNVFVEADASTLTQAEVLNKAGDTLLGSATVLPNGTAGLVPSAKGTAAFLNVSTDFALNADGAKYFFSPSPFYDLALAAFNSTGGEWNFNQGAGFASVGNAAGIVDFDRQLPEPGSLALLGLALAGMGGFSLRRKQSV